MPNFSNDGVSHLPPLGGAPRHIAIIMDGNGRWAQRRLKPRVFGHQRGAEMVRNIVQMSAQIGVEALTLFTFSDENWGRPTEEVGIIMKLLSTYIRRECEALMRQNVRLRVIGDLSKVPESTRQALKQTADKLSSNTGIILTLAIGYGARSEMTRAMKAIATDIKEGRLDPEDVTQELISSKLDTHGIPDPDYIIRTSGECRISNFLLWQAAYAEFYFTPVMWPDFTVDEFLKAIEEFGRRTRRFGLTTEQLAVYRASNDRANVTSERGTC